MVTNHFFSSFLLHSLHLPHLFIFFITPLSFLSTKTSLPSFFSSHFLTVSFPLFLSSSPPMAPKAKKSFYVLSSNAFHLTRYSGATRLVGPSPLTYRPKNHIPMGECVGFSFFLSHFQVSLWSLVLMCFFNYVIAWVLLWNRYRWKPDVLGRVGTCLGLILDDASLKMSKNCFCLLLACVGSGLHMLLVFMCTQLYSCVRKYVLEVLCTWK